MSSGVLWGKISSWKGLELSEADKAEMRADSELRARARRAVSTISDICRRGYEAEHRSSLITMVEIDAVNERWVQEAINALRRQLAEGTEEERVQAKKILKQVGAALRRVGKGQTTLRSREERQQAERDAIQCSRAVARLMKKLMKWKQQYSHEDAIKQTIVEFKDDSKIPEPKRSRIAEIFRERARTAPG